MTRSARLGAGGLGVALLSAILVAMLAMPADASSGPGHRLWRVVRGRLHGSAAATAVAESPDGSVTFVAGLVFVPHRGQAFSFSAVDTATGSSLSRARAPALEDPYPSVVAVSPDGGTVFFGGSDYDGSGYVAVIFAYDASSGSRKRTSRFAWPGGDVFASSLMVSPDGSRLYEAAQLETRAHLFEVLFLAYDTTTGNLVWQSRYRSADGRADILRSATLSGDGARLYALASASTSDYPPEADLVVVAVDTSSGAKLWAARRGRGRDEQEDAGGISVTPDGSVVLVGAGWSTLSGDRGIETFALDAASGTHLWSHRTSSHHASGISSVELTPDGTTLIEAGHTWTGSTGKDLILGVDRSTGRTLWMRAFLPRGFGYGGLDLLALSADGSAAYAGGTLCVTPDCDTPRYMSAEAVATSSGDRLWGAHFGSPTTDHRELALAASPTESIVVLAGDSYDPNTDTGQEVVVAYQG